MFIKFFTKLIKNFKKIAFKISVILVICEIMTNNTYVKTQRSKRLISLTIQTKIVSAILIKS